MFRPFRWALIALVSWSLTQTAFATTYDVGPGQPYASIGAVPLASLQPGDTVRIHYRTTPYKEKWVICRQGTAAQPITFTGVPGPKRRIAGDRRIRRNHGARSELLERKSWSGEDWRREHACR